jgi:hypothetical protein
MHKNTHDILKIPTQKIPEIGKAFEVDAKNYTVEELDKKN